MKKIFFGMLAIVAMIATSCQQEVDLGVNVGETATVSFNVGTPTRAYSDGTTATELEWAVYDANGVLLSEIGGTKTINLSTTVELQLVTGNQYTVLFWAEAANAPYIFDAATQTVTVDYTNATSSVEAYDAFYACHPITVNGAQTESVELKRPFAQLNIGTNDYLAAANAGYTVTEAKVETTVYTTLNLVDGTVDGPETVEFDYAAVPTTETFPVAGYEYMAMNYLLVSADKALVDVKFTYTNGTAEKVRTVGSVPVQRNYRTNIYGQLLTSDVDINVTIEPEYAGVYDNPGYVVVEDANGVATSVAVESANGLATVAQMIEEGELPTNVDIALEGDIDLSKLSLTRSAVNWTPIGTEAEPFVGVFNGNGYTIKNLYIVETEAVDHKVHTGFFGFAKNATIKNVTFENVYINIPCLDIDHSQGHIGAVAGTLEGTSLVENVTVKGDVKIYATQENNGASRVAAVVGGNYYADVTMKKVHVIANEGSYVKANNNTGGLAGQLQGKCVFENCTSNIDVTVNKFFAGGIIGIAPTSSLFTNCHTTGDIAVVAGRAGRGNDQYRVGGIAGGWTDGKNNVCTLINCSYTGKVSGKNADGSIANPLDYLGYVGRGYTLAGCAGSTVIIDGIRFVQKNDNEYGIYDVINAEGESVVAAASKEDLPKTNDGKIDTNFTEDTTLFGDITVSANETNANSGYGATGVKVDGSVLDGKGNTLTVTNAGGTWDCVVNTTGGTIKNLTVKGAMRGIFMGGASSDLYIDNVVFQNVIYTFNSDGGNTNYGVYISNCTINGWTSHSNVHKEVVYTNCSFGEGSGYAFCRPYGPTVYKNCEFSQEFKFDTKQSSSIVFENCTHNGVKITAENAATLGGVDKQGNAVTFFYNGVNNAVIK